MGAVTLLVPGIPRTKKNSGRIVRAGKRHIILPSAAWCEWAELATHEIAKQLRKMPKMFPLTDADINCKALFYRDANRGDAVGFYQGLADLLEKAGVVCDDVQIVAWDGSRLLKDSANPRVELTLTPLGAE